MKFHQLIMKHQSRQENLVYLVMWGMLFAAPLLSLYLRNSADADSTFDWQEVFIVWQHFAVYLLLFLIHNFLLAPLLVHKYRRLYYILGVAAVTALFALYQCTSNPRRMEHRMERHMTHRHDQAEPFRPTPPDEADRPDEADHPDGYDDRPDGFDAPGDPHGPDRPQFRKGRHHPPAIVGEHDIVSVLVLILIFGANLGIKGYFKSRTDQKKLANLQKQNLEQQLEYLKYQINPHFFMNTLNNIHALVDIDPEKAKSTIVELSKMMRFVLYEGDKKGVPVSREFDFVRNYITLMRLRYTDKVKITVDLPSEAPDKTVPPLMLISFVENAFKHGISYQRESFIDVKATVSGNRLHFTCRNSKADMPNKEKGGVGLANVKQRLNLLYDNNYTLNIQDNPDVYDVELNIPLS